MCHSANPRLDTPDSCSSCGVAESCDRTVAARVVLRLDRAVRSYAAASVGTSLVATCMQSFHPPPNNSSDLSMLTSAAFSRWSRPRLGDGRQLPNGSKSNRSSHAPRVGKLPWLQWQALLAATPSSHSILTVSEHDVVHVNPEASL